MEHEAIKHGPSNTLVGAAASLKPLRDVEMEYLLLAIQTLRGDLAEVARCLRISRTTIYRMLAEGGHDVSKIRSEAKARPLASPDQGSAGDHIAGSLGR